MEGRVGRRHGPSGLIDDVRAALDDDLDTIGALAAIDVAALAGHDVIVGRGAARCGFVALLAPLDEQRVKR